MSEVFKRVVGIPPRKYRKYVLESNLWTILVDGIFATPFKVLGDYGENLAAVWSQLFGGSTFILLLSVTTRISNTKQRQRPAKPFTYGLSWATFLRNGDTPPWSRRGRCWQ